MTPDALPIFKPLCNRADSGTGFVLPEDGFYQIVPLGTAPNKLGGKPVLQQVDAPALEAQMAGLIDRGGELLVDREHESHDLSKRTDAMAWIVCEADALEIRADGLYNRLRLTTAGEAEVGGGVLRFTSPEFSPEESDLQWIGPRTLRPLRLTGLALTNRPGFKTGRPLTNRAGAAGDSTPSNAMHTKLLAQLLGKTEDEINAMDEAALGAAVDAMAKRLADAEAAATTLQNREIDGLLEQHKDVLITEGMTTMARQTLLANRDTGIAFLADLRKIAPAKTIEDDAAAKARAARQPLHNREQGGVTPPAGGDGAEDKVHARAMAIKQERGCDYETARFRARVELAGS